MSSTWVIRRKVLLVVLVMICVLPRFDLVQAEGGLKGGADETSAAEPAPDEEDGGFKGGVDETPTAEAASDKAQNDSSWTSELLGGVEVIWDEAWTLSTDFETAPGDERVRLIGPGGSIANVWVYEEGRGGPPEDVAEWMSDEFLDSEYQGASIEVVLSEEGSATSPGASLNMVSAAGMTDWAADYRESHPAGEAGVYVVLRSFAPDWESDYAALPGIEIDGVPTGQVLDPSEVADAVAGYTPVPYSEEAAGLISDQSWVSQQCGHELDWTADLETIWVESSAIGADEIILEPEGTVDEFDSMYVVTDPLMTTMSLLDELDRWTSPTIYLDPMGTESDSGVLLQEVHEANLVERLSSFSGGTIIS